MKFEKAKPNLPYLRIALQGGAGAGKTFTALTLGDGLAKREGKPMAVIDTDPGSPASLYAAPLGPFEFLTVKPRNIEELIHIVQTFDANAYSVLVMDTITWLWRGILNIDNVKRTSVGTVQFGEWNKLKALYREVLMPMVNMQCHTIVTGRERKEYTDSDGELRQIGFQMIAENETPYETNLYIRLSQRRSSPNQPIPQAHVAEVLRDRTGILQGAIFENMTFENINPLVNKICGELKPDPDEIEQAIHDQAALGDRTEQKAEKFKQESARLRLDFERKIHEAKDIDDLKKAASEIEKTRKRDLSEDDRGILRKLFADKKEQING